MIWKLKNITIQGVERPRIDDVSIDIASGVTAVIGYSGAGKTSLLNLLVGFEKQDSGTISVQLPNANIQLPLYWVPQNEGLWSHLTVHEHLRLVASESHSDSDEISKQLVNFDLADQVDRYPDRLSLGERARLNVVRALVSGASVLVMDEPLAHVDPSRIGKYWQAIRNHCARSGASLIFATHSPEAVLREAATVVCLKEGKVLYAGLVDELYQKPGSRELAEFLGPANWFEITDAHKWLGCEVANAMCVRLEQLRITAHANSPFSVVSDEFVGSVAETVIQDGKNEDCIRLLSSPTRTVFEAGQHVRIEVLSAQCEESQ